MMTTWVGSMSKIESFPGTLFEWKEVEVEASVRIRLDKEQELRAPSPSRSLSNGNTQTCPPHPRIILREG